MTFQNQAYWRLSSICYGALIVKAFNGYVWFGSGRAPREKFLGFKCFYIGWKWLEISYYENLIPAVSSNFSVFGYCLVKEERVNTSSEVRLLLIFSEKYKKSFGKFWKWFTFRVLRNICHSSYKLIINRPNRPLFSSMSFHWCNVGVMVNFLLRKIFRKNLNEAISLAEIAVTLYLMSISTTGIASFRFLRKIFLRGNWPKVWKE